MQPVQYNDMVEKLNKGEHLIDIEKLSINAADVELKADGIAVYSRPPEGEKNERVLL